MSHGLFYRCIHYVSGPVIISVVLLSMEGQIAVLLSMDGQIALRFHQNILKSPCSQMFYPLKLLFDHQNDILNVLSCEINFLMP